VTHPNVLHAQTALHALADALGMVDEAIRDEAITRVRVGPPSAAPRRGPRSIARLSALIHSERCDRVTNARAGIHQIGSTCAPVRAELLDLAHRAPGLLAEVATDAAWIIASSLRRRPLLVYGHAWRIVAAGEHPAVGYLRVALPCAPSAVAQEALAILDGAADHAWSVLRLDRPHMPMPGNPPCPCCDQRMLRVETSGPRNSWAVTCGARCECAGPVSECLCGMVERCAGVRHIWPLAAIWRAEQAEAVPTVTAPQGDLKRRRGAVMLA